METLKNVDSVKVKQIMKEHKKETEKLQDAVKEFADVPSSLNFQRVCQMMIRYQVYMKQ